MIWCPSLLGLMALIPHPHVTATGITVPSSPCCSSHVPSTSLLSHSQRGRPNGKFGDLLWLRSCATYVFLGNVFLTTEEQRITDFSCRHFAKMLLWQILVAKVDFYTSSDLQVKAAGYVQVMHALSRGPYWLWEMVGGTKQIWKIGMVLRI